MSGKRKISPWNTLETAIEHLQSIAVNGLVPQRSKMEKNCGHFARRIHELGGYRNVVSKAGLKIDIPKQKPKPSFWDCINTSVSFLQSIADNGRVPGSSEMQRQYGKPFTRNMTRYGGYKKVVRQAGLSIRTGYTGSDGHILASYYEFLFDEYLFLNGIEHETEGRICNENLSRYDFKIGDVYIEIWGISLSSSKFPDYSSRRLKKEILYKTHELKLLSFYGIDFRKSSDDLQKLFCEKLASVGILSGIQKNYPVFNRRKLDYWNDTTIIKEIGQYIELYKNFPTANDLLQRGRNDLRTAIKLNGGYRKFAKQFGVEPKTKIYSEESVLEELIAVVTLIGHFPNDRELNTMGRKALSSSIRNHGGYGHFKEMIVGSRDKKPFGYWQNEDNVIKEIKMLADNLGHFPKYSELGIIAKGVNSSKKGMHYFKQKVYELQKDMNHEK